MSGTTGPVGSFPPSPSKKRKTQEVLFSQALKEHASRQTSQALRGRTIQNRSSAVNASNPPLSKVHGVVALGFHHLRLFTGLFWAHVVQIGTVKGLCELLVIASREAANACLAQTSFENGPLDKQPREAV